MSWRATAAVKEIRSGITRSEKFLLLILADYHNAETGQCDPTLKRLGEDALMTDRAAQIIIKSLEAKGFIEVEKRYKDDGSYDSNQYWLTFLGGTEARGGGEMVSPPPGDPSFTTLVNAASPPSRTQLHHPGEAPIARTVRSTANKTAKGTATRASAQPAALSLREQFRQRSLLA